jgi:hypothetical protein
MFAMTESFFLDGVSRLDNVDDKSLATVSESQFVHSRAFFARLHSISRQPDYA